MRLYNTSCSRAHRAPRAARPDRDVRLRPDRLRPRAHRQRAAVRARLLVQALAARARLRRDARPQHHRRERQDLRGGAGRERRARPPGDRVVPRGHRPLRARRGRPLAQGDRDDGRDRSLHRRPDRARLRLRGRGRRLLPGRALRGVRPPLRAAARPARGRGGDAEPAQGGSARLRALEGEQAGGGHGVGLAVGTGAARLAHRVLGDGREAARDPPSRSTAAGSTSSSPTTRTRWRSRGRSGTSSRRSGCTTACSASPARRCRSRSATSRRSRRCSTAGAWRRRCSSS